MPSHQTGVRFGAEKPLQCINRHIRGDWSQRYQQVGHHQEDLCRSSYQSLGPKEEEPQGMANNGNMEKD